MTTTMRLDGASDLITRLRALPDGMTKPVLLAVLKEAAEPMRARQAVLAPRSNPDEGRPGHLGDHIVVSATRTVEGQRLDDQQAAVAIGPASDYWWGIVQEFGPLDGRYSAQPFARPAFDATEGLCLDLISSGLWTRLRALAEKGVGPSFESASLSGGGGEL